MRSAAFAALSALLLLGMGSSGFAASGCTGWGHLAVGHRDTNFYDDRARQACVRDVIEQTSRAGLRPSTVGDTLFFWFGNDMVAARCMSRTLVAFSAYHRHDNQACPLQDRVKFTLRLQN
jgi:hypothetical protein